MLWYCMDTSSDKYTVVDNNSLDISLDNVIEVGGGLYRCVYWEIGTLLKSELCVYVYGKSTSLWGGVPTFVHPACMHAII